MNKAKRTYELCWWGWRPFCLFSTQHGRFSGYVQVGPVSLTWFG
jgi:hypothetical protein